MFELFGFTNARILDGGRMKWEAEGRPMVDGRSELRNDARTRAPERDDVRIRAFLPAGALHLAKGGKLVDVRSPQEFSGEKTAHAGLSAGRHAARRPHPDGAKSVPWARAANADGTSRPPTNCARSTRRNSGLGPTDDVIAYCRIGERSSHTWFVLTYLLGYKHVRNYDGSWTEWGNAVRAPIAIGSKP